MNKYKFTYMWWCSVCKDEEIVEAETEEEAYKKFSNGFGYESIDIISCEQINKINMKGYTDVEQSKKLAKILPI